jgi:PIN domain nuclease of toxin-antitoxin system
LIILDTHVLLRLAGKPEALSRSASTAIRRAQQSGGLGIAAATLCECAWLARRGRIRSARPLESWLGDLVGRSEVQVIPLTVAIAAQAAGFAETFPSDPMDRLIAGTAVVLGAPLVTADDRLLASPMLRTIW